MALPKRVTPLIKWTGTKRNVMPFLSTYFPESFNDVYDPFVGSGALIPFVQGYRVFVSDLMPELISMWRIIETDVGAKHLKRYYRHQWERLQEDHDHYYRLRDWFNAERDPYALLALTRFSYGGLVRFNSSGEYNVSFHHTRPGIHPDRFDKLVDQWRGYFSTVASVQCQDYFVTLNNVKRGDFVFLDPPYMRSKGMYSVDSSEFDYQRLVSYLVFLNRQGAYWMLTLGGQDDNPIPQYVYKSVFETPPGSGIFRNFKSGGTVVHDKVYVNYHIDV